jgi:3-deoxy-D-manno-octulosonate 8-phosphate phosphatase (KDO 8-P phosphatase)
MATIPEPIARQARRIELLILDVDGVLTDGKMYFGPWASAAAAFNSLDGSGIKMLQRAGVRVGIITGRASDGVAQRAAMLGIQILHQNIDDKLAACEEVKEETGLPDEKIAYMGDDLPDLIVMRRVGLAIAPPNACPEVLEQAHVITERRGGEGAVREAVEALLKCQGKWQDAIARYHE